MLKRIGIFLGVAGTVGILTLYLWIALGLGHQLERFEYRFALGALPFSLLPMAFGIFSGKRAYLGIGAGIASLAIFSIITMSQIESNERRAHDLESRQKENSALISRALHTLACKDSSKAIVHTENDPKSGIEIRVLSLIDPELSRMPDTLCIARKDSAPLCRGLDRFMKEKNLDCSNSDFSSLESVRARLFTEGNDHS